MAEAPSLPGLRPFNLFCDLLVGIVAQVRLHHHKVVLQHLFLPYLK